MASPFLNEVTNDIHHEDSSDHNHEFGDISLTDHPVLRRSISYHFLSYKYDSRDTLSLESDSIHDAETIRSIDEQDSPGLQAFTATSSLPSYADENILPLSFTNLALTPPHSRWPPARLEPILERKSRSTLRASTSHPRVRRSPERVSHVVRPEISIHSIRPGDDSVSPELPRLVASHHQWRVSERSFSCTDLDCLPKSDTQQASVVRHGHSSSSSTEILRAISVRPVSPLRPTNLPPARTPTPTGLPSFGTREALEYRLTPALPPSRTTAFMNRWMQWGDADDLDRTRAIDNSQNPLSSPPAAPQASMSIELLKRMLGTARVVSPPPQQQQDNLSPRVSLPPGVHIASTPGALIQAHDGTMVRGRWGHRASAHGLGSRGLDSHPLSRMGEPNSIEAVVREIDKACEMVARTSLEAVACLDCPPDHHATANMAHSGLREPSALDAIVNREVPVFGNRSQGVRGSEAVFQPGLYNPGGHSTTITNRMEEPSLYVQARTDQPPSDSLAALQEYIRREEQRTARQLLEDNEKEKEDQCTVC